MKIRLTGDPGQVDDTVAALEKTPWLTITKTSRPYPNRRLPYDTTRPRVEQVRVYLDVEIDGAQVVDVVLGTRGKTDFDIKTIDGRREAFRNRRPAMTFRCQIGHGSPLQCTGTVRISPSKTHGQCPICGTSHGRDLTSEGQPIAFGDQDCPHVWHFQPDAPEPACPDCGSEVQG